MIQTSAKIIIFPYIFEQLVAHSQKNKNHESLSMFNSYFIANIMTKMLLKGE